MYVRMSDDRTGNLIEFYIKVNQAYLILNSEFRRSLT